MKSGIHPNLHKVTIFCACGEKFENESTLSGSEVRVEICSKCHPFFTGKSKIVDAGGRLAKFNQKLKK